jgi:hypothetical protein
MMALQTFMKKFRIVLVLFGALAAAGAYYLYGGSSAPEGQPGLVRLTPASFTNLQAEFNQAGDKLRVVVMLSPT